MRRRWAEFAVGFVVLLALYVGWSFESYSRWAEPWFAIDNQDRDITTRTRLIMAAVAPRPGMVVADIGAGGGYFSVRLARRVAPAGRVIATDSDWHMVVHLRSEAVRRHIANLTVQLVDSDELGLDASSTDVILMTNVYLFDRCDEGMLRTYIADMARALRPGGRAVVQNDFIHSAQWHFNHGDRDCGGRTSVEITRLAAPWFDLVSDRPTTPRNVHLEAGERPGYLLVLRRRAEGAAPSR